MAKGKKVIGGDYTGVIIGRNANGQLVNCSAKGDVEGTAHVGGVTGYSFNNKVKNVSYEGNITSKDSLAYVGGFAGYSQNDSLIVLNVTSKISANGTNNFVGGIAGYINGNYVAKCIAENYITATGEKGYIGGLVGRMDGGSVVKCLSRDSIIASGHDDYVGGLVGYCKGNISESVSTGVVKVLGENSYTGGIVGMTYNPIVNCYSTVKTTGTYYTAGLCGYTYSTIDKCYAKGDVYGSLRGAGVVAQLDGSTSSITNSIAINNKLELSAQSAWGSRVIGGFKNGAAEPGENNYALNTMQVSLNGVAQKKTDDPVEGIAKTKEELQKSATYIALGWDFSNIWGIDEDEMYPYLLCEKELQKQKILIQSISLDNSSISLEIGNSETLNAIILPEDATNKSVTWSSSNESVATVSSKGVVTAVSVGTAIIIVNTNDGSNLSDSCKVVVTADDTDISKLDNALYIKKQSVSSNSQVTIPIFMKNNVDVTAFSFELVLPEGMTIAKNDKGKNLLTLNSDRAADDHSLSSNVLEDGSISVACLSLSSETFEGNDGVIINATVNVSADIQEGNYPIVIKNIKMATPDTKEYKVNFVSSTITVESYIPGDVNNDKEITIVDAVGIVNFIIKADTDGLNQKAADANQDGEISIVDAVFVVNKVIHVNAKSDMTDMDEMSPSFLSLTDKNIGNAETFEMPVVLNGKAYDITAMQGNIILPEGITLEGISADDNHVISYNTMDDGTIRMACLSLDNSVFSGNGDVALTLKLRRDASFVSGEMSIESTELVTPSLSTTRPSSARARLTTGGATSIDGISADNDEQNRYDLSGRKINKSLNGVYIENGKKFIEK